MQRSIERSKAVSRIVRCAHSKFQVSAEPEEMDRDKTEVRGGENKAPQFCRDLAFLRKIYKFLRIISCKIA